MPPASLLLVLCWFCFLYVSSCRYVKGLPREDAPHLEVPLHHVFAIKPQTYTCDEEVTNLLPTIAVGPDGQKDM